MKKLITLTALFALLIYLLAEYLGSPRDFEHPDTGNWQTPGQDRGSANDSIIPNNQRFCALHGDTHNSDELTVAASLDVQLDWTTESHLFIAEGPTEDRDGNLYFSPIGPQENLILVSLEPKTGARRWAVPSVSKLLSAGGGAPLILNDPDNNGQQIIYLGVYDRAVAVRQNGEIIWDVPTGLVEPDLSGGDLDDRHVFGLNYHAQSDALVGLTAAGDIYILDRVSGKPLLAKPYQIQGAPGKSDTGGPGPAIANRVDLALAKIFGPLVRPLSGGISRYKPAP